MKIERRKKHIKKRKKKRKNPKSKKKSILVSFHSCSSFFAFSFFNRTCHLIFFSMFSYVFILSLSSNKKTSSNRFHFSAFVVLKSSVCVQAVMRNRKRMKQYFISPPLDFMHLSTFNIGFFYQIYSIVKIALFVDTNFIIC